MKTTPIDSTEQTLRDLLTRHRQLSGEQSKYQTARSHATRELAALNERGNLLAEDIITRISFLQAQTEAMSRRLPALETSLQDASGEIVTAAAFFVRNDIYSLIENARKECAGQARKDLEKQFKDEYLLDQAVAGTSAIQTLDTFKLRANIRSTAAEFSGNQACANYAADLLTTFEELQTFVTEKK